MFTVTDHAAPYHVSRPDLREDALEVAAQQERLWKVEQGSKMPLPGYVHPVGPRHIAPPVKAVPTAVCRCGFVPDGLTHAALFVVSPRTGYVATIDASHFAKLPAGVVERIELAAGFGRAKFTVDELAAIADMAKLVPDPAPVAVRHTGPKSIQFDQALMARNRSSFRNRRR